jgi:hypothetical protein
MKTIFLFSMLLFGLFVLISSFQIPNNSFAKQDDLLLQANPLEKKDIELLTYMREEEKLAKDVYNFFYKKYNFFVFNNIAQSEQTHIDRIVAIMDAQNIPDTASKKDGVFNNPELQKLYNQLIEQGNQSLTEALKVGATIEDVDIKDLMDFMDDTQNVTILNAFEFLTCGSRNHMRAFVNQLKLKNVNYNPQFISNELFQSIVNGSHERCMQNQGMTNNNKYSTGNGRGKNNSSRMPRGNCLRNF